MIEILNKEKESYDNLTEVLLDQHNNISDLKKDIIGLEIELMKAHQSFERADITATEDLLESYKYDRQQGNNLIKHCYAQISQSLEILNKKDDIANIKSIVKN